MPFGGSCRFFRARLLFSAVPCVISGWYSARTHRLLPSSALKGASFPSLESRTSLSHHLTAFSMRRRRFALPAAYRGSAGSPAGAPHPGMSARDESSVLSSVRRARVSPSLRATAAWSGSSPRSIAPLVTAHRTPRSGGTGMVDAELDNVRLLGRRIAMSIVVDT